MVRYDKQATQAGGIDTLKSIPGLLRRLQTRALALKGNIFDLEKMQTSQTIYDEICLSPICSIIYVL